MKVLFVAIFMIFFGPVLAFFGGWVGGWMIQLLFGTWITNLLTYFNVNLPVEQLPFLFGFIAAIGTYFKVFQISKSEE